MVVDSWDEMGKLGPRVFFCLISTFTFTGQSWFDPLFFILFCFVLKKTWTGFVSDVWSFIEREREIERVNVKPEQSLCLIGVYICVLFSSCPPVLLSCQVIWSGLVIGQVVSSSLCLCNITLALSALLPAHTLAGHLINKHQQSTSSWLLASVTNKLSRGNLRTVRMYGWLFRVSDLKSHIKSLFCRLRIEEPKFKCLPSNSGRIQFNSNCKNFCLNNNNINISNNKWFGTKIKQNISI